ncbi:MAG: hypothetical protein BJ554DRAFT_2156 [Olpidium bornovanus]|uniref:GYF domain-containing protein n=1 Tax=Olpidium bornovanus TaxID=278681 RepID=A0A8H7ZQL5_9FUNG|nr:MAG: hypothetical protein BJ554DRAFT_2156 [Olpidium bornovanus]
MFGRASGHPRTCRQFPRPAEGLGSQVVARLADQESVRGGHKRRIAVDPLGHLPTTLPSPPSLGASGNKKLMALLRRLVPQNAAAAAAAAAFREEEPFSSFGGVAAAGPKRVRFGVRGKAAAGDDEAGAGTEGAFEEFDHEASLEQRKERRGTVNLAGYRSGEASSDEEEVPRAKWGRDARTGGRATAAREGGDGDEDDDMFADSRGTAERRRPGADAGKEELDDAEYRRLKRNPRYLSEGDIAWQDYASRAEFDEKGEQVLEAFNLKEEMEEGRFDNEGNYVRRPADPQRFHDSWLDGLGRRDFERAKLQRQRAEEALRKKEEEAGRDPVNSMTREQVWTEMLKCMKPGETVTRTLRRLGGGRDIGKAGSRRQSKGAKAAKKPDSDGGAASTAPEEKDAGEEEKAAAHRKAVESFTVLVDRLVSLGDLTVYGDTYESLAYRLSGPSKQAPPEPAAQSGKTSQEPEGAEEEPQWEYKWDSTEEAQVFGPYPVSQMTAWAQQGFFEERTHVRRWRGAGGTADANADDDAKFVPIAEINYSFG